MSFALRLFSSQSSFVGVPLKFSMGAKHCFYVVGVKSINSFLMNQLCKNLESQGILQVDDNKKGIHKRIHLNVNQSDLLFALNE